jgi:hypothetical protein
MSNTKEGQPLMKRIWTHRHLRFALVTLAATTVGAALASAGFAGLQSLGSSAASQQYPHKKVTLCHHTHSKKHPWVQITVSEHAVPAHLRHGDFVVDATHPCPVTSHGKKGEHKNKKGKHEAKKDKTKNQHKSRSGARKSDHGKGGHGKSGHGGGKK